MRVMVNNERRPSGLAIALGCSIGALAVVVAGCAPLPSGSPGVPTMSPSPVSTTAATVTPTPRLTPRPTVPPTRAPTPVPALRYLASNAFAFRDGLSDLQNFTCPDVGGEDQLLFTYYLDG
jgi:hypothetical protein